MDSSGQMTVLVADVSGGSKLYAAAGYAAALEVIARCIERVRDAAESTGGQVVKTNGDKVMVLFASADAAAQAATRMHANIEALPEVGGAKLGVQVGFHSGPVYRCDEDLLGDTVKLASRMVEQAQKGQTITSQQTAALLSPSLRALSRQPDGSRRVRRRIRASAADPDVAAGGAVIAAVPTDQRGIAAFRALRAKHDRNVLWRRRFQDAHLLPGGAVLVEDAEHGVAVQH